MQVIDRSDYAIVLATLTLVGFGVVMISSSSSIMAQERFGDPYYYLKKQLAFAVVGAGFMVCASYFPTRGYRFVIYPVLALSIGALILVLFLPEGRGPHLPRRWIRLGGLSIQPSEAAKLALVLYLSHSLSKRIQRNTLRRLTRGVLPHLLLTGLMMWLVIEEPDLGTALVMGALALVMMFVAGVRLIHLLPFVAASLPVIYMKLEPYQMERLRIFLQFPFRPWEAPSEVAYQVKQSCFALANGGWIGQGLGMGFHKLFYLPEPQTDFIISVIGEECGILGVSFVVFLFVVIIVSGSRVAMSQQGPFETLLAFGIVTLIGLQAFLNMAMAMGLIPTKGMTLPFVSYGGSSLVVNMTASGILVQLARHTIRRGQ